MAVTQARAVNQVQRSGLKTARLTFYHVYIACTLGLSTVLLIPRSQAGATAGGGALFQASWILLLGATFLAFLTLQKAFIPNFLAASLICAYVMASTIWSVNPSSTLIYGLLLSGNIFVAYMITTEYNLEEILRTISRVILWMTILGLAAYAARLSFSYYFDHQSRANLLGIQPLRGLFPHKITGGLYAVMGAILAMNFYRGPSRVASIAIYALFVTLTGSASALLLGVAALLVSAIANGAIRQKIPTSVFALLFFLATCVTSALVYINQSAVLQLLGRDSTLTGRTYLWQYGLDAWNARPILGWGFNGYFTSEISKYIQNIGVFRNYDVPHFHQSYIQTLVDLGLVGFSVVVGMLVYSMYYSYKWAVSENPRAGAATFSMVTIIAIGGLAIYVFIDYNHFATFFLFIAYFGLRSTKHHRTTAPDDTKQTVKTHH